MADADLARLRAAMQTLGDLTHHIDLPTDYGDPLDAYRLGMKALADHELLGDRDLILLAASVAAELVEVFDKWAGKRLTLHGKRQAVKAAAAVFLLAATDKANLSRPPAILANRPARPGTSGAKHRD